MPTTPDPFFAGALAALAESLNTLFAQTLAADAETLDPLTRAHNALVTISNRCSVTLPQERLPGRVDAAQVWPELRGWIGAGLVSLVSRPGSELGEPACRLWEAMAELVAIECERTRRAA